MRNILAIFFFFSICMSKPALAGGGMVGGGVTTSDLLIEVRALQMEFQAAVGLARIHTLLSVDPIALFEIKNHSESSLSVLVRNAQGAEEDMTIEQDEGTLFLVDSEGNSAVLIAK